LQRLEHVRGPDERSMFKHSERSPEFAENVGPQRSDPMSQSLSAEPQNGSVLVAGGGIAGMQAALDLANAGFYVYLVEKSPAIGGAMAQLDKTFPTNDCSM